MISRTFIAVVIIWISFASMIVGQSIVWTTQNPCVSGASGYAQFLYPFGDYNQDGHMDALLSDITNCSGGAINTGLLQVLSGIDGSVLWSLAGTVQADVFSWGVVGDLNADGVSEYIFPSGNGISFDILSGANHQVYISAFFVPTFLVIAEPLGDINGDGYDEFAMPGGAPPPSGLYGTATVHAGPLASTLVTLHGDEPWAEFGIHFAPGGDMDGDFVPDVIVAAQAVHGELWSGGPGWAYACSGADGSIIHKWTAPTTLPGPGTRYGSRVAGPGDVNGDGIPDALVAATRLGQAYLYSGADGTLLGQWPCFSTASIGPAPKIFAALGDIDFDGHADFGIKSPSLGPGMDVISGRTHAILMKIHDPPAVPNTRLASFVPVNDSDGDGFPNIIVGAPRIGSPGPVNRVHGYTLAPPGVSAFGSACAPVGVPEPVIGFSGAPLWGTTPHVNLITPSAVTQAALALGLSSSSYQGISLPHAFAPVSLPGCELLVSIDALVGSITVATGNQGVAQVPLVLPPGAASITFYAQWGVLYPAGLGLTRGLEVVVQ